MVYCWVFFLSGQREEDNRQVLLVVDVVSCGGGRGDGDGDGGDGTLLMVTVDWPVCWLIIGVVFFCSGYCRWKEEDKRGVVGGGCFCGGGGGRKEEGSVAGKTFWRGDGSGGNGARRDGGGGNGGREDSGKRFGLFLLFFVWMRRLNFFWFVAIYFFFFLLFSVCRYKDWSLQLMSSF